MTLEDLRIELARALIRGADDDGGFFEWHACVNQPACRAAGAPPQPCACAGAPYLSDAAWAEIVPVLRRIQRGGAL